MVRRARLQFYEHELGDWMRARRAPDVRLSGLLLDRELLGYQHSRAQFASWLEPPRPQVTIMIDLDGRLDADGEVLPDAWIGGLTDRPTVVGFRDGRIASWRPFDDHADAVREIDRLGGSKDAEEAGVPAPSGDAR